MGRGLRIYVEFDLGAPITIGRASYLAVALRWMGMVNVYDHEPRAYFAPDLREVPNLRPDFIIYEPKPQTAAGSQPVAMLAGRGWGAVPMCMTPGDHFAHYDRASLTRWGLWPGSSMGGGHRLGLSAAGLPSPPASTDLKRRPP